MNFLNQPIQLSKQWQIWSWCLLSNKTVKSFDLYIWAKSDLREVLTKPAIKHCHQVYHEQYILSLSLSLSLSQITKGIKSIIRTFFSLCCLISLDICFSKKISLDIYLWCTTSLWSMSIANFGLGFPLFYIIYRTRANS